MDYIRNNDVEKKSKASDNKFDSLEDILSSKMEDELETSSFRGFAQAIHSEQKIAASQNVPLNRHCAQRSHGCEDKRKRSQGVRSS